MSKINVIMNMQKNIIPNSFNPIFLNLQVLNNDESSSVRKGAENSGLKDSPFVAKLVTSIAFSNLKPSHLLKSASCVDTVSLQDIVSSPRREQVVDLKS